jgi:hypothetical protein
MERLPQEESIGSIIDGLRSPRLETLVNIVKQRGQHSLLEGVLTHRNNGAVAVVASLLPHIEGLKDEDMINILADTYDKRSERLYRKGEVFHKMGNIFRGNIFLNLARQNELKARDLKNMLNTSY